MLRTTTGSISSESAFLPVNSVRSSRKALAQPTKSAFLFVLNRETGEPIWPIEERPVPQSDVPGEHTSPTQPFPTRPPAYDHQGVTLDNLIDFNSPYIKRKRKEEAEIRNSAESLLHQTEKFLADNADKVPADAKANVDGPLAELKAAIEANDAAKDWLAARGGLDFTARPGSRWIRGEGNTKSDFVLLTV